MSFVRVDVVADNYGSEIRVGSLVEDDYVCGHSAKVISLHKQVDKPNYKAIIADFAGNVLTCYKVGNADWFPKLKVIKYADEIV